MIKQLWIGVVCVGMVGASGCARHGGAGDGESAELAAIKPLAANSFAVNWRATLPLEDTRLDGLAVNDDKVFAVTQEHKVFWIGRPDGVVRSYGRAARQQDVLYAPVTMTDRVVFPSSTALTVFDRSGKEMYSVAMPFGASSGGVGEGKTIFIGGHHENGGRGLALDARAQAYTLPPLWAIMTYGDVSASPAVFGGLVFVGSEDGGVYALRAENRDNLWPGLDTGHFVTGGPITADVKADKDGVYVASRDSKLYCLDLNTGRIRWAFFAGQPLGPESSPTVVGGAVYVYLPGVGLAAIDKAGKLEIRKPKWVVAQGVQYVSGDDRYAYVRSLENRILAVDKATGEVKFTSERHDLRYFATNLKDSTIYAATESGEVLSIRPVTKPGTVGELVLAR